MTPLDPRTGRPVEPAYSRMRRVVIDDQRPAEERRRRSLEERQRNTLEHLRVSRGYGEDVSPHAHDQATFRLINQRKDLDELAHADYVVPTLDEWKHWTKMNDWDSRNGLLEQLTSKMRRCEATPGEVQVLVTVCRPVWMKVVRSLRRYGGGSADPRAAGAHRREEVRRINELDRDELDQVVHHALLDALSTCPRPFPRRFFAWVETMLVHRALDHVRRDLTEHDTVMAHDVGIREVVERVLADERSAAFGAHRSIGSRGHDQWVRTLDLPAMFELSAEYATYARTRSACERAVERLPGRQREVVQSHYFETMTQAEVAGQLGLAESSVRNSHAGALRNLRRDDDLFDVLEAVGKVRDRDRRLVLQQLRQAA
jgi:RNA polymerase sigma factor (sigma-70 family)